MESTRNIFIQIDTDSVIQGVSFETRIPVDVNEHTLIFNQGSMALGNAVKSFSISATTGEDIYFTILPLKLYGHHKVYFTGFNLLLPADDRIVISPTSFPINNELSFKIHIERAIDGGLVSFALDGIIEFEGANGPERIPILIDPVLRANQGN